MLKYFILIVIIPCFFINNQILGQTLVLPQQYKISAQEKNAIDKIDFYTSPYTSDQIDLRGLKKQIPDLTLSDYMKIEAPYLGGYQNIMVLFGILEESKKDEQSLIVIIAANYESEEVTFFIDENQDRNFNNDIEPLVLDAGGEAKKIFLKPFSKNILPATFWLQVPAKEPELTRKEKIKQKFFKTKIKHQFALGGHLGFGTGSLKYQYDNTEIGFPTWYTINMTEKNVGLSLTYSFPKWRIGLTSTYQNLFYYTSYINIRTDDPEIRISSNGIRTRIENVEVNRNQDSHTNHRFQWAFLLAYRGHVSETMEIQPIIKAGLLSYLPAQYSANRYTNELEYELPASPFVEVGARTEFTTGLYKAFFLGVTVNKTWWRPNGMFEALPQENLDIDYLTWRGTLGYRVGLF